jgi:putative membrane protein
MSTTITWKTPLFFKLEEVEGIAEEEASVTLNYTPPVILPDDAKLETEISEINSETDLGWPLFNTMNTANQTTVSAATQGAFPRLFGGAKSPSLWLWLLGALGLLLGSLLMVNTYQFMVAYYQQSVLLGSFLSLLTLFIGTTAIILAWQAYQNLQTLRQVSALQEEGRKLRETNGYGEAIHYVNKIAQFYMQRPDIKLLLDRFYVVLNDSHHDRDICQLFSQQVMKDLDQQAYRLVAQHAKETSLLLMISQKALLDTVLMLWRNLHLIREIATLYGTRPGGLSSLTLLKGILQNLVYADVSEVIAESTAEILGHSMLSMVSTQMAQGLGGGMLVARLGLQTMQTCRPLPFTEAERPRLREIRREMITTLKTLMEAKKN